MKMNIRNFTALVFSAFTLTLCTNKGDQIIEPDFGTYRFTTYTVDTFRFRISLNGEILTDSLMSPQGAFSRIISFFKSRREVRLVIAELAHNNQVILDSVIELSTGINNISIVQFEKGKKPTLPQLPNEPAPAPGNYKVRFQYTPFPGEAGSPPQPFFYDSIRCILRKNGTNIDTFVLEKFQTSLFYEAAGNGGATFSLRLENPLNGSLIDVSTSPTIGSTFTGFNSVSVSGKTALNDWRLVRMY